MKKVLVTGATGFIGSGLVAELARRGYEVIALHRPGSNLKNLQGGNRVELRSGDILDLSSLENAMKGCDTVFHTAALISFFKNRYDEQFRINVLGTRNVVEASLRSGLEKLVHTSTVGAIGRTGDGSPANEDTPYNWGKSIPYRYTKHLAEIEVTGGVKKGLNSTIVNPSIIIGAGDINMHGGQFIREIKLGRIPFYTKGGINLVASGDVVAGHIAAAEKGRNGHRYILSGENLTHLEWFRLVASVTGGKAPRIRLPGSALRWAALAAKGLSLLPGIELPLNPSIAENILSFNWFSHDKAASEFGYSPGPIRDAVIEAYGWYKANGIL